MPSAPPAAGIRREVMLPLRFMDGYSTTARLITFDGLVDGREHVALGLGTLRGKVSGRAILLCPRR